MSETAVPSKNQQPTPQPDAENINLLEYVEVVVKHRKMIAAATLAAAVLSVAGSLMLTNIYSATARILPPQQDASGLMGMLMGGSGMGGVAADLLGKGSSADMYVGILNSEALSDRIIDRFKLMEVYREKYRVDAYKTLDKKVDITAGKKDGIITIVVDDQDPKLAAAIANAYVEELGKVTVGLNVTGAGQNKGFLEERLAKSKVDLAKAEDALKAFQSRSKIVDVNDQAQATIVGVAQLKAQLVAQEVQLASLQRMFTDSSQEVKNVKTSIANLRSQMARLEGAGSGGAIPGIGSVPELGQQYLRLMREFKIQETLVELLTKQYEMAKLSEAKDVNGIQVIQKARVPDKKSKPKRSVIVLAATFLAGFMAVLYAFLRESGQRMSPENRERWRRVISLSPGVASRPDQV